MRRVNLHSSWVVCAALVLTACGSEASPPPDVPATSVTTSTAAGPTSEGVVLGAIGSFDAVLDAAPLDETVEAIMLLVRERLIGESEPRLVAAETRKWENAALDCPAISELPDLIPTEGLEVRVDVDGVVYDVRVSEAGEVRMCAAVVEGAPVSLPLDPGSPPTTMGSPTG